MRTLTSPDLDFFAEAKNIGITINYGVDAHGHRTCTAHFKDQLFVVSVPFDHETPNDVLFNTALVGLLFNSVVKAAEHAG